MAQLQLPDVGGDPSGQGVGHMRPLAKLGCSVAQPADGWHSAGQCDLNDGLELSGRGAW